MITPYPSALLYFVLHQRETVATSRVFPFSLRAVRRYLPSLLCSFPPFVQAWQLETTCFLRFEWCCFGSGCKPRGHCSNSQARSNTALRRNDGIAQGSKVKLARNLLWGASTRGAPLKRFHTSHEYTVTTSCNWTESTHPDNANQVSITRSRLFPARVILPSRYHVPRG